MTQVKRLRTLVSAAICTSVLTLCLLPSLPWAQSRGGELVQDKMIVERQFTGSYALLIGVSNYQYWKDLPGVKDDLVAMKALLKEQGFEVETVVPSNIRDLENAYNQFIRERGSSPNSRLLLYFAGHGMTLPTSYNTDRKLSYIVSPEAPETTATNAEQVRKYLMPLNQMYSFAETADARHILFAFDSCFAGDWLTRGNQEVSIQHLGYLASKPVRQFITAGGAGETVPDRSLFRPLFERALREGAADVNQDGYVTGTELKTYLQKQVIDFSRGMQHPQYGVSRTLGLDQGDFIFKVNGPLPSPTPVPVPEAPPTPAPTPVLQDQLQVLGGEWISLPSGTFTMGSNEGAGDEKPPHSVTVSAFKMSKTEITNAQYNACVQAKQCTPQQWKNCSTWPSNPITAFQGDTQPVVCVDWSQAKAFATWIGGDARLPTEAEWEYAARGEKGRKYPWGDAPEPSCDRAIMDPAGDLGDGCGKDATWPVCSKTSGNTPTGLCDMAGNVWEWVEDWHGAYSQEAQNYPSGPETGSFRVLRGGSWFLVASFMRGASRGWIGPTYPGHDVGFRVVVPLSRRGSR